MKSLVHTIAGIPPRSKHTFPFHSLLFDILVNLQYACVFVCICVFLSSTFFFLSPNYSQQVYFNHCIVLFSKICSLGHKFSWTFLERMSLWSNEFRKFCICIPLLEIYMYISLLKIRWSPSVRYLFYFVQLRISLISLSTEHFIGIVLGMSVSAFLWVLVSNDML